ncbi:MAG: extracellular solute-binding protein [Candidatus Adiutrix sp.]|jgi:spermidine/putrescine transport system substrate-binding protein|nr:extracellular solute-binding protein [Candidatus Adiutrix sp.]
MKKRLLYTLLALVLAGVFLAGCDDSGGSGGSSGSSGAASSAADAGGEAGSAATAPPAGDSPQQTLVVANWKGYGSDSDYGAKVFEEKYDCKVVHQYFTSLEEMVTMLKQGGLGKIDVILPNSQYMKVVMDQGLTQKVDVSRISSFNDLRPDLRDYADAMDAEGAYYAMPWTWGTTSLGYNPKIHTEPITSWKALWDQANKGKVGIFDEYYSAILVAGLYTGQEDIYNPDLAEIKEALTALKNNTRTFWASYDDFLKPYMAQEITIGNMWAGIASQLLSAGEPVAYVYPDEGAIAWADYWAIVKDAPNYELAVKWLDFMTGEEFQTAFATDENAHSPVNEKVAAQLTDDQKKILWLYPEAPAKIFMQKAEDPKQRGEWLEIWNEIKSY